jgi:tRNA dimethylallyltransferase
MSKLGPKLIFLVGPTASGKTSLAIEMAKRIDAEIISADSVQFYSELKIGSARPSEGELAQVKHHLVGHISVVSDYTAGDFARDAVKIINDSPDRNFLVVGGSGFYIQALEKGMFPTDRASEEIQESLEKRVDVEGLESMYALLRARDPEAAKKIAVQDRYRIVRALEILETLPPLSDGSRQTLSQIREDFEQGAKLRFPGRAVLTIGLRIERARLEPRVRLRTEQMLNDGLIDEARALVERGLGSRPALQSVGYKEVLQYLAGQISEAEVLPKIIQGTLRLAKKQRTWFQRAPKSMWFDAERDRENAIEAAIESRQYSGQKND